MVWGVEVKERGVVTVLYCPEWGSKGPWDRYLVVVGTVFSSWGFCCRDRIQFLVFKINLFAGTVFSSNVGESEGMDGTIQFSYILLS